MFGVKRRRKCSTHTRTLMYVRYRFCAQSCNPRPLNVSSVERTVGKIQITLSVSVPKKSTTFTLLMTGYESHIMGYQGKTSLKVKGLGFITTMKKLL
jgi:hypothetical protein